MIFPPGSGHFAKDIFVERPGRFAAWFVSLVGRLVLPLVRIFYRGALDGTENLPKDRPFLLVSNHNAGLGIAELGTFYALYLAQVGPQRPLAGFALPLGFKVPLFKRVLQAAGAIPSTYEAAEQTLAAGVPILMFPGGDYETTRPVWQANRVDFGGRVGFLRIARKAGVAIVPMGIRGSHVTAPMLFRSESAATLLVQPRLIGQKRWAISLLGVIGAALVATLLPVSWPIRLMVAWLWLGSPLSYFPWLPSVIRMRIGQPIESAELFARARSDDALERALARVEGSVQELVNVDS